jgi:hypothetical protein
MATPATIMAIAVKRNTSMALVQFHSRNAGETRLRIRVYIKIKMERVPIMVDTRDTGPCSIAQKDSTAPTSARSSFKVSIESARPWYCIQRSSLKTLGLNDNEKNKKDMQNAVSQYIFQEEIWAKAYLLAMSAAAVSKLELRSRRNDFPNQMLLPVVPLLIEAITAPATTIITASHCREAKLSPNMGIAIMATKTG